MRPHTLTKTSPKVKIEMTKSEADEIARALRCGSPRISCYANKMHGRDEYRVYLSRYRGGESKDELMGELEAEKVKLRARADKIERVLKEFF